MTFAAAFANAFLCAFLLDCALTVADGASRLFGATPLLDLRNLVAWTVFWAAPLLALVALLSSRLPRGALLLLAFGAWWVNLGAAPLGGLLEGAALRDVVLGAVQAALALPALRWIRRRSGGGAWLFRERFLAPARRPSIRAVALALAAVPLALSLGLAGCAVYVAERATGGFVGFGLDGVSFDERRYTRGDREVVLVGMSHVGRRGVYDALLKPSDDTPTVVLAEGVTDSQGLLPDRQTLEPLAEDLELDLRPQVEDMLGVAPDVPAVERALIEVEHADLDVSDFRPSTVEILRLGLRVLADPRDSAARAEIEALFAGPDAGEAWRHFLDDVLEKRNAHVLGRIDEALERRPRVVVPWGALHLAGIEAGLVERGFALASSEPRSFLPYGALLGMLTRAGGP